MPSPSSSRYHVVPRDSMDSDHMSAHEFLLPSPSSGAVIHSEPPRSVKINPSVILRLVSGTLAFVAFLLLVIGNGGHEMIAPDVFLMMTCVFNIIILLHRAASSSKLLTVNIKIRDEDFNAGRGTFKRPKIPSYIDLCLSICLLVSLPVCFSRKWYTNGAQVAAVVMGYIVIAFHAILAIPMLDRVYFTAYIEPIAARSPRNYMVHRPDIKPAAVESTAIPAPEEPVQDDNLV